MKKVFEPRRKIVLIMPKTGRFRRLLLTIKSFLCFRPLIHLNDIHPHLIFDELAYLLCYPPFLNHIADLQCCIRQKPINKQLLQSNIFCYIWTMRLTNTEGQKSLIKLRITLTKNEAFLYVYQSEIS